MINRNDITGSYSCVSTTSISSENSDSLLKSSDTSRILPKELYGRGKLPFYISFFITVSVHI